MTQLGFYFDMTKCTGCRTCQIACKDKNELPVGTLFRMVKTFEGGKYPNPWVYHLSMTCNHCADPQCVKNCPTGCRYKREEDGLVLQDMDKCIGCGYCIMSCPYGFPQRLENGKVSNCNMCVDLLDQGLNPACVDACMTRALDFGDIDKLKAKYGGTSDLSVLPSSSITNPSVLIKAKLIAK
ncbi:MAG: DMSO/selenate family reductase complex B subunit [Bacillota bacterium]|nr:DMSO/selenate family reductase complex B subunit [Bacillota bacterium]